MGVYLIKFNKFKSYKYHRSPNNRLRSFSIHLLVNYTANNLLFVQLTLEILIGIVYWRLIHSFHKAVKTYWFINVFFFFFYFKRKIWNARFKLNSRFLFYFLLMYQFVLGGVHLTSFAEMLKIKRTRPLLFLSFLSKEKKNRKHMISERTSQAKSSMFWFEELFFSLLLSNVITVKCCKNPIYA